MQTLLISLLFAASVAEADPPKPQQVYVLGSSLNLREQPSVEGAVVDKLPIGTECQVTEKPEGTWLKVRCGQKEGYASAALLGPQKPSAEQFKAEARDTKRTLEQREDSALRAATLAPDDAELREMLGNLFFEGNFKLLAGIKKPVVVRTFSYQCFRQSDSSCLTDIAGGGLKDVRVRAETKGKLFVVAVGDADRVAIYRGRYRINTHHELTGEVIESTGFAAMPVLDEAIFFTIAPRAFDKRFALSLGQFVLDEDARALLKELPRQWSLLERDNETGFWLAQWSDCLKRPFFLTIESDIHGRWRLVREPVSSTEGPVVSWITSVARCEGGLALTLDHEGDTTHELLKLPQDGDDIAFLGDKAYAFKLNRHAAQRHECLQGGP